MGRLLKPIAALVLALAGAGAARAGELDLSVDLRAVRSDGSTSRLDGGLGPLRFDADHQGLRLGYLRAGYRADPTPSLHLSAEAVAYGDHDVNPVDLTEAWAEWRPLPKGAWRSRVKLGAFYPEISLENRMRGWRSPYTLSWSAINSWVGEELRTIGAQYSLDWLGLANGHSWEASASVAAFGWNDPAGTVIGFRGWGFSDRQTTLFGRFANRGYPNGNATLFYDDLDHRAGYHAGGVLRWRGLVELRALHYDNRARLGVEAPKIGDETWLTRFESVGVRVTPNEQLTLASQWLHGRTYLGPPGELNAWSYGSEYLLASWQQHDWRWSVRYDRFTQLQTLNTFPWLPFPYADDGHAWTAAAGRRLGRHWHAMVEFLRVDSDNPIRTFDGGPAQLAERQWQLSLRWER